MPNPILIVFFSALAFALAASSDWFEARFVRAVRAWEDAPRDAPEKAAARERAARSSVMMWVVGTVALVAVIEVGWYVLPAEALGLYAGSKLAMR